MIFVTVGSQKFQFNRLLIAIDNLLEDGTLNENVFAQSGYSDYIPKNYQFKNFLDREEYNEWEKRADIIVTHGGTGAIVGAVKRGKKVIAVPRLAKYGEHVDDHQLQLINQFKSQNLICSVIDCNKIKEALFCVRNTHFDSYKSCTQNIIESIERFIDGGES